MNWWRSFRLGSEADHALGFHCCAVSTSGLASLDPEVVGGIRSQIPKFDSVCMPIRAPRRLGDLGKIARIDSVTDHRAAIFICAPGNHRGMIRYGFQNGALRDIDLCHQLWRRVRHDRGEYGGQCDDEKTSLHKPPEDRGSGRKRHLNSRGRVLKPPART